MVGLKKQLNLVYYFEIFPPDHQDMTDESGDHDHPWRRRQPSGTTRSMHCRLFVTYSYETQIKINCHQLSFFFFFSYPDNHPPPLLFYLFISLPCETTSQIIILSSANLLYPDSCVRETLPGSTAVSIDGASSNDVVLLTRNKWKPREGAGQDGWGPSVSPNVYFIRVVCIPCFFLLCYTQSS